MSRYLRLLLVFVRVSLQNDTAYRADLLLQVCGAIVHVVALLMGLWVIFRNTSDLNGWTADHMLALVGVFRMMSGIIGLMIAPNMRRIIEDVRLGTLDFVLLKPVNSQFLAGTRRFTLWRAADVLLGLALATAGAVRLHATIPLRAFPPFFVMLAAGIVVIYSFWLILATLSFWLVRVDDLEMVFWNVFEAGRYPITIYGPRIRWTLTYVMPVAFVVFFPAQALVGGFTSGVEPLPLTTWAAAGGAASAMFVGATLFWRYGVRRYSGASA